MSARIPTSLRSFSQSASNRPTLDYFLASIKPGSSRSFAQAVSKPSSKTTASQPSRRSGLQNGLTHAQRLAMNLTLVFGSGAIGYVLSSTLRDHDLPLLPSVSSKLPFLSSSSSSTSVEKDDGPIGPGTNRPQHGSKRAYAAAITALEKHFGSKGREDDVSTDDGDLTSHGLSEWSYHDAHKPSVVVWAKR